MTLEKKKKKKTEETREEKIERVFLKEVRITQEEIDAVENAINTCNDILHYYLDNFPPKEGIQDKVISLTLDCDRVSLSKHSLDLAISELSRKAKEEVILKKKNLISPQEAEAARNGLAGLKEEVKRLINNTQKIVDKIKKEGY